MKAIREPDDSHMGALWELYGSPMGNTPGPPRHPIDTPLAHHRLPICLPHTLHSPAIGTPFALQASRELEAPQLPHWQEQIPHWRVKEKAGDPCSPADQTWMLSTWPLVQEYRPC